MRIAVISDIQFMVQLDDRLVINPGSVGMPFEAFSPVDGPTILGQIHYAVLTCGAGACGVEFFRMPA